MNCAIHLLSENSLKTDAMLRDKELRIKASIMGIDANDPELKWQSISLLENKFDRIHVMNTISQVGKYTFAFEEAIKRVENIDCLYFVSYYHSKAWSMNQVISKETEYEMQSILKHDYDENEYSDWDKIVYLAWSRIYNIDNKEDVINKLIAWEEDRIWRKLSFEDGFYGKSVYNNTVTVLPQGPLGEKFLDMFPQSMLTVFIASGDIRVEIIKDVFSWSNHDVTVCELKDNIIKFHLANGFSSDKLREYLNNKYKKYIDFNIGVRKWRISINNLRIN